MTLLTMTQNELDQIAVFERLTTRKISQQTAAQASGLSMRQTRRKLSAYRTDGARSLIHGARGKRSNRQLTVGLAATAVSLVAEKYLDFGTTFAAEKLAELDGVTIEGDAPEAHGGSGDLEAQGAETGVYPPLAGAPGLPGRAGPTGRLLPRLV